MTRRAAVWRDGGRWIAEHCDATRYREHKPLHLKAGPDLEGRLKIFPTHAEALAWALARVGLAPTARVADTPTTTKETP